MWKHIIENKFLMSWIKMTVLYVVAMCVVQFITHINWKWMLLNIGVSAAVALGSCLIVDYIKALRKGKTK